MFPHVASAFRCIAGCAGEYPLDEVIYRCPSCGDLLEVVTTSTRSRPRSAAAWIKLFDERYLRTQWPYGSGVWGKKEWVQPHLARRERRLDARGRHATSSGRSATAASSASTTSGSSSAATSHTGSFKDLGMTVLVSTVKQMIADGKPIRAVACASTGDTSAALAAYAAAAGIRAMVILPRGKVSTAQLVQPLANGALVLALDTDFDGCMAIVQRLAEEEGVYLANCMNSLRLEGQKTVAIEIVQQFDWEVPDWVIIPGGNLGNVSALGAGFQMMLELGLIQKLPRICVAQAEAANPLYRAYKAGWDNFEPVTAQADARVGDPDRQPGQRQEGDPHAAAVRRRRRAGDRGRAGRRRRARRPHRPVHLPAHRRRAGRAREAGRARRDPRARDRVVVVSTANGLKFTDFKVGYHEGELPEVPKPRYANTPVKLPNDYAAVRDAVRGALDN